MNAAALTRELASAVEAPVLDREGVAPYLLDATEARRLCGCADAVVLAKTADDVARTLAWCYEHDVPPDHARRRQRLREVAEAVEYLVSAEFATGTVLVLDGGLTSA